MALIDTGATPCSAIHEKVATVLRREWQAPYVPLPEALGVEGYNGQAGNQVTHALILTLQIDGRRFVNTLFLVTNLGHHDLILGRAWLAHQKVLADCANHRLVWPDPRPSLFDDVANKLATHIPMKILARPRKIEPEHQTHAEARDRKLDAEIQKEQQRRDSG